MLHEATNKAVYSLVSDKTSVYLIKTKVVSVSSEMILYHFTSD